MRALLPIFLLGMAGLAQLPAQEPDFQVIHVRGNVYMFASDEGNVTVQEGTAHAIDGVLLVDTGTPKMAARIAEEIRKLTSKPVRYIVNTSMDADHIGGNGPLGRPSGGFKATQAADIGIFAHDSVLNRMTASGSGVPDSAWPTMTFSRLKDFTFDGEGIQIFPEAPAHTDGDVIVFFRGSNVISTGEIFSTEGFPVIDLARGGSIQGEVRALNQIVDLTVPDMVQEGGTMVIPGHGRLCDQADVVEYRDMVTIVRDRVADQIKKGKSLDEVKQARLSRDYDARYSRPAWTGDMFVESIYKSLKQDGGKVAEK